MSTTTTQTSPTFTITRTARGALLTRNDGRMLTPANRDITFQDSGIATDYVRYFHGAAEITYSGYGA